MSKIIFVLLLVLLMSSVAFAEVVVFKNGNEVNYGSVVKEGDQYCAYVYDGLFCFPADLVASVEQREDIAPPDPNVNVVYGSDKATSSSGSDPNSWLAQHKDDANSSDPNVRSNYNVNYNNAENFRRNSGSEDPEKTKRREELGVERDRKRAFSGYSSRYGGN